MSDMADHIWGNRWFAEEISQLRLPLFTAQTHYPEGGYLWHIDPIGGLIQLLTLWLPPHMAWHFGIFIQLSAMGTVMALYANSKLRDMPLSIGLGLALVFSAHVLGLLHSGLSEYVGIVWLIALMWSLESPKNSRSGILLGICFWQAAAYGLLGAILAILSQWKKPKSLLHVALVSAVVAAPAIAAIQWTSSHPAAAFQMSEAAGWNPQSIPSIDVLGWIMPGHWLHPNTPAFGNPGIVQAQSLIDAHRHTRCGTIQRPIETQKHCLALGTCGAYAWAKLSINRWMPLDGSFYLPMSILYLPSLPTNAFHHPYHIAAIVLPIAFLTAGKTLKQLPSGKSDFTARGLLLQSSIHQQG